MTAPRPDANDGGVWELLAARIATELGLDFTGPRQQDLQHGLASLAPDMGCLDAWACAQRLLTAPWPQQLAGQLASHLTVGESYFFRDPHLLDLLAGELIPQLVRRRRAEGRLQLRVWSAGCCSGEEPYTLAILLNEALPDIGQWDVAITATDINPRYLEKARAGRYSEWSFRGVAADVRQRYFERSEGGWQVSPDIQRRVRFAHLNLAQPVYPSPVNGTEAVDILFCRNVLMYFRPPQAHEAARRLSSALAEGGWLVVSPSEACTMRFPALVPVSFEAGVVYSRPTGPLRMGMPAALLVEPEQSHVRFEDVAQPAASVAQRLLPPSYWAKVLADWGELDEALAWCDRWLAQDRLDASGHCLRGLILMERGDAARAREALRRCLYLDPGCALAHFALGQLARAAGREREARRHVAAAERLRARASAQEAA